MPRMPDPALRSTRSDITSDPSAAPEPAQRGSTAALAQLWSSQLWWWHVSAAALIGLILLIALIEEPGPHGRWPRLAACAIVGALYLLIGVRALRYERSRWGPFYLTASWATVLGLQLLDPYGEPWLWFFVLFPHTWAMLSVRWAAVTTAVVLVISGVLTWLAATGSARPVGIAVTTLIALVLSVLFGLLINRVLGEAEARAGIIDELRATQDRLAAVERERGGLAERERLAQEIHDTLAQGFTSILALARAADAALGRADVATARQRLALVQSTAAENLDEARLIVAETTPGHLQSRTLVEALQRLVTAFASATDLEARFEVTGTPVALGAAADVGVLRAAQECLANVRRHAAASQVVVAADYPPEGPMTLKVTDDGVGFDASQASTGFGLDGIRVRTEQLGGSATVRSEPGAGTVVTVEVPR